MTSSTISRLRKIGRNKVLTDHSFHAFLPPHWGTLYELAGMQDNDLENAINAKKITGKTSREEAQALKVQLSGRPKNKGKSQQNASKKADNGSFLGDGPNVKLVMTLIGNLENVPEDLFERFQELRRDLKEFVKVEVVIDQ